MGRYLLFIVLAAVVGGALLTLSMRSTLMESLRDHSEDQADVLAREIAEAGVSVALGAMVGGGGFQDPTARLGTSQDYEGGRFAIEYVPGADGTEATLRVTGRYGGAVHTVESTYAYEPVDAPGPLWLDVPYATASAAGGARIAGDGHDVQYDRRKHDDLGLGDLLPLGDLDDDLGDAVSSSRGRLAVPAADAWEGPGGLLDGLNVRDAEGLYQKALGALDTDRGDARFDGDWTVGGPAAIAGARTSFGGPLARVPLLAAQLAASAAVASGGTMPDATFGSAADGTQITLFDGDLTVAGSLSGHGVLLVGGALRVEPKADLTWNGIVIVRDVRGVLPVELEGEVDVTGMMVIVHEAFPPGGHLDVSVYRAQAGMDSAAPQGDVTEQRSPWNGVAGFPWHQHTHAFDVTPTAAPRGDRVYFAEGGAAGRHESAVQFRGFLSRFGAEPVYLAFGNAPLDGYSRFRVDVAGTGGTGGVLSGHVRSGFGRFAAAGDPLRSRAFPAHALRSLDVDVLSLRALKKAFDDPSCDDWPICIGQDWNRRDALAVRVHRASDGARLHETAFYWHMRLDEIATHEAEEEAWRTKIRNGEEFGTHLTLGKKVRLTFDLAEIRELSERLAFDGSQVVLISSTSSHVTAAESRAQNTDGPTCAAPTDQTLICNKPRKGETLYRDRMVECEDVPNHLGHGCYLGSCASNSLPHE